MSEFANSYANAGVQENAYQNAVESAQASQSKTFREKSEALEKSEERDKKFEPVKETLTTLGVLPLEEGVRGLVSDLGKTAKKKVGEVVEKTAGEIKDKVLSKADELLNKPIESLGQNVRTRGIPNSALPENFTGLPKTDTTGVEEALARRSKLARLKANTERKLGKFKPEDNLKDANNLTDDIGQDTLNKARSLTSQTHMTPQTLSGQTVEDINPDTFFKGSKGFDATGELTRKSAGNPYSVFNENDVRHAMRAYKEYKFQDFNPSTGEELNKAKTISSDTQALITKTKPPAVRDQLAPMRERLQQQQRAKIPSYKEVSDDIKASLPDIDDLDSRPAGKPMVDSSDNMIQFGPEDKPRIAFDDITEPRERLPRLPREMTDPRERLPPSPPEAEPEAEPTTDALGQSSADQAMETKADSISQETKIGSDAVEKQAIAKAGEKAGEDAGESVGKTVGKDIATEGEDIVEGSEGGIAGEIVGGVIGLGSILGGIFGHKHHSPAPPPPPPPALNPAYALGI